MGVYSSTNRSQASGPAVWRRRSRRVTGVVVMRDSRPGSGPIVRRGGAEHKGPEQAPRHRGDPGRCAGGTVSWSIAAGGAVRAWRDRAMKLSEVAEQVIRLGRAANDYWETELPKRHPDYPLVRPGEDSGPPPPEEAELRTLLNKLPEDM